MILQVKNASFYDGRFPLFREPSEIGCFSLNMDRKFCDDQHQLKYLVMPRKTAVHMDLNLKYAETIRKEFGKTEKLDTFLTWISFHQEKILSDFSSQNNCVNVDFVCFRGLLTALCSTIYENRECWLICATRYRGIIYLCAFDTEEDIKRRDNMTDRDRLMCAWGYKFEQFMTTSKIGTNPNPLVPVNEKEEFDTVLKGRLNDHTILFSAEVDAEDHSFSSNSQRSSTSTKKYVEFKTSRIIETDRQDRSFCRYKLLKWWLQSFLAGIPRVICGFRDDNGIVRTIETFEVKDMPKMAQSLWSPAACLNFCSYFLDYVKRCVVKDNPKVVYKFFRRPGEDITCEELSSPQQYQILPEWYIASAWIGNSSASQSSSMLSSSS